MKKQNLIKIIDNTEKYGRIKTITREFVEIKDIPQIKDCLTCNKSLFTRLLKKITELISETKEW